MMENMKRYKAVPEPESINVNRGDTMAAFNSFASIINDEAKEGWTFHSMETITVTEKPGCMQQPIPINYYSNFP